MPASRSRILLWSSLSGLLWALAWPAIGGLTPLAFVAWLPLLHAERLHNERTVGRKRAFTPYVIPALFIWNLACSWWFWCVSEPVATKLISVSAPVLVNTCFMLVPWWLKRAVRRSMGEHQATIAFVLFWIAMERLRHSGDLQWPWFSMGNVFATWPMWVQWYEFTGMLGGSLWVLLVNLFVYRVITDRAGRRRWMIATLAMIALPLIVSLMMFGAYPMHQGRSVEVVVVQPNVDPYNEKFLGAAAALDQLEHMLAQADAAITDSTVLVLMPETALQEGATVDMSSGVLRLNGLWENDLMASRSAQRIERFQSMHPHVAVLTGMSSDYLFPTKAALPVTARPLFRMEPGTMAPQRFYESYNAAMFMPVQGPVRAYHKSKLVAGVELVPFEELLGPLHDLSVDLGGTSGSLGQQVQRSVLSDPASGIAVVPAICYESVFGEHVAAHVLNGGNCIAIITNDAWWSDSPGYKQHLSFASLRAIETRRDIARSANTGISCFVDQRGVMRQATVYGTPDAQRGRIYLNDDITFFVRHGDVIGRAAMAAGLLLLLVVVIRAVRRRAHQ